MKFFLFFCTFLLIFSVGVQGASIRTVENFQEFYSAIDEINLELQEEPIILHPSVQRVVKNEDVAVHVETSTGLIQSFVITIYQNYVTGVIAGPQPTELYIEMNEEQANEILHDPDLALEYYQEGKIEIKSTKVIKRAKLHMFKIVSRWFR